MPKGRPKRIHGVTAALALTAASWLGTASFAQNPDFHIYLGIGQSNMEGGPKVAGLAAADPRFQVLSVVNCPSLTPPRTMGMWYTANPPLPRCSAGPGIVDWFGRTLVDSLPKTIRIGVIMVTVIGTKIELFDKDAYQAYLNDTATEDWLRNYAKEYGGNPYGRLMEMAKIAQKDGVIRGILLHQGESNVGDEQWPARAARFLRDIVKQATCRKRPPAFYGGSAQDFRAAIRVHHAVHPQQVHGDAVGRPAQARLRRRRLGFPHGD